ncbi:hypothetical protein [Tahibacter soli]|uniref:Uncharacterized protein n=1 Tax=Tahibacter soli TaxID=2983605 RepID=A0A9X4BHN8_9GAMM|nr:hypothetical protein [Tahibacter soli]MDC8014400.1 hypothetical protein [Tahibacter soli]
MRRKINNRGNRPEILVSRGDSGVPDFQSPSKQDLDTLDAAARAHVEPWTRPRAIFIGVGQGAPAAPRYPGLVGTSINAIRSLFRRVMESFFGPSVQR